MAKKINDYTIPDKLWDEMNSMIENSQKIGREQGILLCKDNSYLKRGNIIHGEDAGIDLWIKDAFCSPSAKDLIATYHTHPKLKIRTQTTIKKEGKLDKVSMDEKEYTFPLSIPSADDIIFQINMEKTLGKNILECIGTKKKGISCYKLKPVKDYKKTTEELYEISDERDSYLDYWSFDANKVEEIDRLTAKKYLDEVDITD